MIVGNKTGNNLHQVIVQADPYNIKTELFGQTLHGYKKSGCKCDSCDNFILEETSIICLYMPQKLNLEFPEIVLVTPKLLYI